jgi:SNF2 family DNA or RNA helicase
MPASLRGALMPFQRDGVQYGLARRGRVLIADEMGVGKTVQALALAACYQVWIGLLMWMEWEAPVCFGWGRMLQCFMCGWGVVSTTGGH